MEHSPAPVVCLSDGHAGNRRQVEALARALAAPDAPHILLRPSPLARAFAPRLFPTARSALGDAFGALLRAPPALAIGCGRQAALATRLLGAAGSRSVQILDPRIAAQHWDVVIAPAHDGLHGDNVIALQGSLHDIDELWLASARRAFAGIGALGAPRIAVLIGGPSRHWPMRDADFFASLDHLRDLAQRIDGRLLVTASRRTPARWREALARLDAALIWRDERDGDNPYRGLLGWANAVVCSADSVNMLSEAAATAVPVQVIGADQLQGRPRRFLDHLLAAGRVTPLADAIQLGSAMPLRETTRVAQQLRLRLGLCDGLHPGAAISPANRTPAKLR